MPTDRRGRNNVPEHLRQPLTRRERRMFVAIVLGVGVTAGSLMTSIVKDEIYEARENARQPACEVPIHKGDTIYGIESDIHSAGDDVRGETVEVVTPDGRVRNPDEDPRYWVNGSMAAEAGDTARIQNVDPNVCLKVGGFVLNDDGSRK